MNKSLISPSEALKTSLIAFKSLPPETIEALTKSNDLAPDKQVDAYRQEFQYIRHALICPSLVVREKGFYG